MGYNNQAVEAAFRKELVYAEDGVEGFGLLVTCHRLFSTLRANYYTLFLHLIYFEFWQALFNRCEELIPMLILGDAVYQGNISSEGVDAADGLRGQRAPDRRE